MSRQNESTSDNRVKDLILGYFFAEDFMIQPWYLIYQIDMKEIQEMPLNISMYLMVQECVKFHGLMGPKDN